jgi:hypothetical protein
VARCGICQPRLWLDVAWRGLMPVDIGSPFGSPISLVPLTFNQPERRPETSHCSRPERPPPGGIEGCARYPATRPPAVSAQDRRKTHQRSTSGAHRRGRSVTA